MHQWKCIQTLLQVKTVIDRLKAIEQDTLTPPEREVWQESLERAYEQAASLLPLDLLEEDAEKEGILEGKTMLLSKKIRLEVPAHDAQTLEFMQSKCRGRAL